MITGSTSSTRAPRSANAYAASCTSAATSGSTAAEPSRGLNAIRMPVTPAFSVSVAGRSGRGPAVQSRLSDPDSTSRASALSATVQDSGPTCASVPYGLAGNTGTRP
jgi:hypothetical protein